MHLHPKTLASLSLALLALAGCSTPQPNRYQGIASSSQLSPTTDARRDRVPYSLDRPVAWQNYSLALLDPVTVYGGRDGQFEDLSMEDRDDLSRYMFTAFAGELSKRFRLVHTAQPGTLRIRLTLTGAKPNTAFVSTITRFDLIGGPYNAIQSIRGKEGAFLGSVMYSVEIYDALTNELLKAYVAKQFPNAMNVAASAGRLKAAEIGIDKAAEDLLASIK